MHLSGGSRDGLFASTSHRGTKCFIHISLFLKLQVGGFDYMNVLEKD